MQAEPDDNDIDIELTEEEHAEEARALAGMFVHRILRVPSQAFEHQGRSFLVRQWERYGIDRNLARQKAKEQRFSESMLALIEEADQDIEQMAALMDSVPVWESFCEAVNRRWRVWQASQEAARLLGEYNQVQSAATAAAASAALARVAEAESPEMDAPDGVALFDRLLEDAKQSQGLEFLGITFPSLHPLNRRMDGLRGLTFLGGSPGTGKTSLALQMAFDAAEANHDTVVVFLTCEMSDLEVQASLTTRMTRIPFKVLMKGMPGVPKDPSSGMHLERNDLVQLVQARSRIAALGRRWCVVQPSDVGGAFIGSKRGGAAVFAPIISMVNRAKQASGAKRMLVVVDSLQRVPVAEPVSGSVTGWMGEAIERDNYVVDALNALASGRGDAVLCITEQNKAAQGTASITSMRGTASIGYACDSTLLLTDPDAYTERNNGHEVMKRDIARGFREVEAHLVKGRAGTERGMERLRFSYATHTFTYGAD